MRTLIVISLCLVTAVVFAQTPPVAPPSAPAATPDTVVVTVNGDPVYAKEVQAAAQQIGQSMAMSGQQVDGNQIGAAAMGQIVDGILLLQEARRRGIEPNKEDMAATMARAETQYGGKEQLKAAIEQQGYDSDRFEELLEQSNIVSQLVKILTKDVSVSDEQIAAFYEENKERIAEPEQAHARHILLKVETDASEEDKAAALKKAEAARKRALAGEDFAKLAEELSEGPSAPKGGDLGFFARGQMVQPFSEAAFALKVGGISEVVTTRFGYHVIKVEEHKEARLPPLAEVSDRIKTGLTQQAEDKTIDAVLVKLRDGAEIVPVTPEGAVAP